MKKDPLTLLNTAGLIALGIGALLFGLVGADPSSPGAGGTGASTARVSSAQASEREVELREQVEQLRRRVAALEAGLAEPALGPAPGSGASTLDPSGARPSGDPGEVEVGLAEVDSQSANALVRRGEVQALVGAELDRRRRAREVQQAAAREAAQKKAVKPKRTLREVAQSLNLQPRQEAQIRTHLERIEGESMRVLFDLEPDADLTELAAQLEQAKHDPELKETLRARVAVQWTKRQADVWALYVQLDGELRKVLPKETLARYYTFDVKLERPRFPDLQELLFKE